MTIGPMRHRVALQSKGSTTSTTAQKRPEWTTVGTYWASIRQLNGREAINASRLQATATHVVEMRHVADVQPGTHRLMFNGRAFNIESANNVLERNRTLELMVKEVPG
jgi:SPP1 family predicted phage head-tail adaptor